MRSIRDDTQYKKLIVNNDNGDRIVNSKEIVEYVKNYFQTLFYDKTQPDVEEAFPHVATPLHKPITAFEVQTAIRKLKNGRAVGLDGINSELLKCAPEMIADLLAGILNGSLAHNEDLELGFGILITLQKPGKPCGPVRNIRPIVQQIRASTIATEILSLITLDRIRRFIDAYLSQSHSAYRKGRSP